MIDIVGGVYLERCISPEWNQIYGSGGRAAVALSELSDGVILHTYLGEAFSNDFESIAASFGFKIKPVISKQSISFHYFHGLSKPKIYPEIHQINQLPFIEIDSKNIMRFGFMEGDAKVNGDRVVYDPQSANCPKRFDENGSTANKLTIVLNLNEGFLLTGEKDPLEICETLHHSQGAFAIILKMGSMGTLVWEKHKNVLIPCISTSFVWPIGSGDIFASTFAHFWAERHEDIYSAAVFASHATATYCDQNTLPIDKDFHKSHGIQVVEHLKNYKIMNLYNKCIYIAGPFFTLPQRWLIEEIRRAFTDQGFKVFSPLHDVGRGAAVDVVEPDLKGLRGSDAVLAVIDGLDPGTIFEVGYARSINIPAICFVQNEKPEDLKMFIGSGCKIVNDFCTAIYMTIWETIKT